MSEKCEALNTLTHTYSTTMMGMPLCTFSVSPTHAWIHTIQNATVEAGLRALSPWLSPANISAAMSKTKRLKKHERISPSYENKIASMQDTNVPHGVKAISMRFL